jgi:hypothetical protein
VRNCRGAICPTGTYGPAVRTYGLGNRRCRACDRNLITIATGSTSFEQCINPDGFGYVNEGAVRCAVGSWAARGSMTACTVCPRGRTTSAIADEQKSINNCYVRPGWGLYKKANLADPWVVTVAELASVTPGNTDIVAQQCPAGYYSTGAIAPSINAECTKCTGGRTTPEPGATSSAECSVCDEGYGQTTEGGACSICPRGQYSKGYDGSTGITPCTTCPSLNFYYTSSFSMTNAESEIVATGTTFRAGAPSVQNCVPKISQLASDAGQRMFTMASPTADPSATTASTCATGCDATKCCFAEFRYTGNAGAGTCHRIVTDPLTAAATTAFSLYYKLTPSEPGLDMAGAARAAAVGGVERNSGVRPAWMSSGLYARCAMPGTPPVDQTAAGAFSWPISGHSTWRTLTNLQTCKDRCDELATCWGFIFNRIDGANGDACLLRTGQDVRNVRSLFALPGDASMPADW